MTPFTLRAYTPADLPAILLIEQASFADDAWPAEDFEDIAAEAGVIFWVAEANQRVVGYVIGVDLSGEGYIASIATHPDVRGQGLGSLMLTAMIEHLMAAGVDIIGLHVNVKNESAIRLYEKFGFRVEAEIKGYYMDGSTGLLMIKEIEAGRSASKHTAG